MKTIEEIKQELEKDIKGYEQSVANKYFLARSDHEKAKRDRALLQIIKGMEALQNKDVGGTTWQAAFSLLQSLRENWEVEE
mgnify:CR=1 FL=1